MNRKQTHKVLVRSISAKRKNTPKIQDHAAHTSEIHYYTILAWKSNQGNQDYSGNQKNEIQGQRPDIENRHTRQRTRSN